MAKKRKRTLSFRRRILLATWFVGVGAVLARAYQLQVLEGDEWRAVARKQHITSNEVPGARGSIVDRDGVPLAMTRERVKVSIAPGELADRDEAIRTLQATLAHPRRNF